MSLNLRCLIPARAGSKRVLGKNTKLLGGVPLIDYTIKVARASGLFPDQYGGVTISTDDDWLMNRPTPAGDLLAFPLRRPAELAQDDSPDIAWIQHWLKTLDDPHGMVGMLGGEKMPFPQAVMILRPTSPFRTVEMLHRAVRQFQRSECHSLRAVEPVKQHPGKMWYCDGPGYPMRPVLNDKHPDGTPWHSSPTQTLRPAYVQNASLEIVWTWVLRDLKSLTGNKVVPFFTEGLEGFDINTQEDWDRAEALLKTHEVQV